MKEPLESLILDLKKSPSFLWADEIWFMGVWKNSPKSRSIARNMPELQPNYHSVKENLELEDIYGSPYSIFEYLPDPLVSKEKDLTNLYTNIKRLGKKLILDFVPNHIAIDSPLVDTNPNLFLIANESVSSRNSFLHPNGNVYVHGRDPYFDGWTDTIQWDFSNPNVEKKHIEILKSIAKQCDGVRCDMAMLLLPDVFEKTHGKKSFYDWACVIQAVREEYPHFKFYAEAYWGMEDRLLSLGFNASYDKSMYDAFKNQNFNFISQNLRQNSGLRNIRFLENHDEERAKHQFGDNSHIYFSLLCATDCILLFHAGQEMGFTKKIPVQMIHTDEEKPNLNSIEFYERAFAVTAKRQENSMVFWPDYKEYNGRSVFVKSIETENITELFLWNEQTSEVSGWIPFQEGIQFQPSLTDIVTGNTYPQTKSEQGIYFKLAPNQVQWFIF
ncbi:alpha amylase, catalytic domain protein [Leptospira wolbachii serovar Codice str. CDC]|uniref:Alpha amylase, catalytic domain protein n=1 Tax=Leptospira wolbachii serovar Codice str. CDC TaxID=1218599 RepID=R9ABN9_9LEPT|nr:alpha amylase, catalytic domain protein [Leptospira wolbachii serovar Codice str. CDC]